MVAIDGLAGLRSAELMRLEWHDVRRVPGHTEVAAGKAKTRQRISVPIGAALDTCLEAWTWEEAAEAEALVLWGSTWLEPGSTCRPS